VIAVDEIREFLAFAPSKPARFVKLKPRGEGLRRTVLLPNCGLLRLFAKLEKTPQSGKSSKCGALVRILPVLYVILMQICTVV